MEAIDISSCSRGVGPAILIGPPSVGHAVSNALERPAHEVCPEGGREFRFGVAGRYVESGLSIKRHIGIGKQIISDRG